MKTRPMQRPVPFVPASGGVGLLEKRETVVSTLQLEQSATHTGNRNLYPEDTLLLEDDAEWHNNHGNDPGENTLNLSDSVDFNMVRPRGVEDSLGITDHVHVTLDGYQASDSQYDMTANETVVVGQPVYVTGNNTVNLADASAEATANAIGLVILAASANQATIVRTEGEVSQANWTAVIGSAALTPGATYYLGTTPGTMSTTPPSVDTQVVVRCGIAVTTTKFDIEINEVAVL